MVQWVVQKDLEATCRASNAGIGYILYRKPIAKILAKKLPKIPILARNVGPLMENFFVIRPLYNLPNRQLAGSNRNNSSIFLYVMPKSIAKYTFFKHQNQLRLVSILSNTSGAESGNFWFVLHKSS